MATAEITLGGLLSDTILEAEQLPIKMCGISHCYRTEAGAHGRATRGLYRVHQFTKVEMFAFTLPEQSDETLDYFCRLECEIFDGLGIPYRVIDTASGDLGGPAYRKFDLEAWMPGRGEAGEFGEVTSTSNCTDYQARRLGIRYKHKGRKGDALRPHAERHGGGDQPRDHRDFGELSAGRRQRDCAGGAAEMDGEGLHCAGDAKLTTEHGGTEERRGQRERVIRKPGTQEESRKKEKKIVDLWCFGESVAVPVLVVFLIVFCRLRASGSPW